MPAFPHKGALEVHLGEVTHQKMSHEVSRSIAHAWCGAEILRGLFLVTLLFSCGCGVASFSVSINHNGVLGRPAGGLLPHCRNLVVEGSLQGVLSERRSRASKLTLSVRMGSATGGAEESGDGKKGAGLGKLKDQGLRLLAKLTTLFSTAVRSVGAIVMQDARAFLLNVGCELIKRGSSLFRNAGQC